MLITRTNLVQDVHMLHITLYNILSRSTVICERSEEYFMTILVLTCLVIFDGSKVDNDDFDDVFLTAAPIIDSRNNTQINLIKTRSYLLKCWQGSIDNFSDKKQISLHVLRSHLIKFIYFVSSSFNLLKLKLKIV